MEKVLFDYFNNGGTIVGVSGGAVQLGRTTTLFQLFIGDKDENLDALQLVDFEFLPHTIVGMRIIKEMFLIMLKPLELLFTQEMMEMEL
jgi:peptidase E